MFNYIFFLSYAQQIKSGKINLHIFFPRFSIISVFISDDSLQQIQVNVDDEMRRERERVNCQRKKPPSRQPHDCI